MTGEPNASDDVRQIAGTGAPCASSSLDLRGPDVRCRRSTGEFRPDACRAEGRKLDLRAVAAPCRPYDRHRHPDGGDRVVAPARKPLLRFRAAGRIADAGSYRRPRAAWLASASDGAPYGRA